MGLEKHENIASVILFAKDRCRNYTFVKQKATNISVKLIIATGFRTVNNFILNVMVSNGKNLRFQCFMAYSVMLLKSIFLVFQSFCVSRYFSKHRCQIQQMAFKPERVCVCFEVCDIS